MTKDLDLEVQSRYVSLFKLMLKAKLTVQLVHHSLSLLRPLRPRSISKLHSGPEDRPAKFPFRNHFCVGCGDDGMSDMD